MIVTAHRIGPRKLASLSTGPAVASATRSAYRIARVFGVTSAAINRMTDSTKDTASASHSRHTLGTPQCVNSESVSSVVEVDATIRARVFVKRTVER